MENYFDNLDGFSAGEKLDMIRARGGEVFALAFAPLNEEGKGELLSANNSSPESMIRHITALSKAHPEEAAKISAWMIKVGAGLLEYAELIEKNPEEDTLTTKDMDTMSDKDKEIELEALREFVYNNESVGFFINSTPNISGIVVRAGVHGSVEDIADLLYQMFKQDHRKAIKYSGLLEDVNGTFRRKFMDSGGVRTMMEMIKNDLLRDGKD